MDGNSCLPCGDAEVAAKKRRIAENTNEIDREELDSLESVQFVKVLWNDVGTKTLYAHGRYSTGDGVEKDAMIKLEKCPFEEKNAAKFFTSDTKLYRTFNNDIYSNYTALVNPELNHLKAVSIMPATSKHLLKYTKQDMYFVNETPKDYEETTFPHVKANQYSLQWVYNILEHKAEADRIIFEDTDPKIGFILLPDLKWNEQQVNDLHLTCITNKKGISSIRDLNKEHLQLLKNILHKGKKAVMEQYGLPQDQLRIFFHYQPSYYHLHVHFTAVTNISASCAAGKAHLLDDVIDNIENIDSDYYKKKTLSYVLGKQDPLLEKFISMGKVLEHNSGV